MADFNIQITNKASNGTVNRLHPVTNADNVRVTPKNNIPLSATNVDKVLSSLGALAFQDSTEPSVTYNNATTSVSGLMSASDKAKLDGIKNVTTMVYISTTPDGEDSSYRV